MPRPIPVNRSIQIKSYLIPGLTLVLITIQLLFPFKGWAILASGFGGIWLLSYLWVRSLKKNLSLEREMRFGWMQTGDHLQERISIENNSRFPAIWVQVIDHSKMPGYSINTVVSVNSQWYFHWYTHGICNQRGIYTLGPTSIETGDPLGLFGLRIDYHETVTMMVVPPVVSLPEIEIAPGGRAGEGKSTASGLEQTIIAGGVREYRPGDSLRWLHWPTTARRNKPFVRVFDFSPSSNWWVLLDMDPKVQAGEGQQSTEEYGVILAGSLVHEGLKTDIPVGLITYEEELIWHTPGLGDTQLWKILRSLAIVSPNGPSLPEMLSQLRNSLEQRTSLIIVTSNIDPIWLNNLGLLRRRGIVPTVILLNPADFGGSGNSQLIQNQLLRMGIRHYSISDKLHDFSLLKTESEELYPGERISQTAQTPIDQTANWRSLG
jgi:uncharacterized protein (DUF58 family)